MRPKTLIIVALTVMMLNLLPGGARADRAPDWIVGRYRAYNRKYKVEVNLAIFPDGNVTSNARFDSGRTTTETGRYLDGQVKVGSSTFNVVRNDRGFVLIQVNDRSNRAEYRLIDHNPVPAIDGDRGTGGDGDDRRVPDWLIGHFEGHNRKYRVSTELTIRPDGDVRSIAHFRDGKRSTDSGNYRHHKIKVGSGTYLVDRTRDGFRLTQETDPGNVAEYHRIEGEKVRE